MELMDRKYKILIVILVILVIATPIIYYLSSNYFKYSQMTNESAKASNYSSYFYLEPISQGELSSDKSSYKDESVEDMIQNPEKYKGDKIVETGQIINMTYNPDGYSEFLIWTPDTNRNFTRLFVTYKGQTSYNIGDNIRVYGVVDTYTEYGLSMSFLKAVYIEKIQ